MIGGPGRGDAGGPHPHPWARACLMAKMGAAFELDLEVEALDC